MAPTALQVLSSPFELVSLAPAKCDIGAHRVLVVEGMFNPDPVTPIAGTPERPFSWIDTLQCRIIRIDPFRADHVALGIAGLTKCKRLAVDEQFVGECPRTHFGVGFVDIGRIFNDPTDLVKGVPAAKAAEH